MRRGFLLFAVLLCSGLAGCLSPDREPGAPSTPPPLASVIPGSAELDTGLWRGPQPDADGFRALATRGFRTILNLRLFHSDVDDLADADIAGMDIVDIPMTAHVASEPPSEEDLRRFLDVVTDPATRPVYFHCAQGVDRTGVMAAVYRMEVQGWSNDDALAEMHARGFHGIYTDLEAFVLNYRPRRAPR